MSNLADLLPAGGGQNNTDFVADGNISSGAPVILTSDGKAAPIVGSSAVIGTATNILADVMTPIVISEITGTNKTYAGFHNYNGGSNKGTGFVLEASSNAITVGSGADFASVEPYYPINCYDSVNSRIVQCWQETGGTRYLKVCAGSVSGTTITWGTPVTVKSWTASTLMFYARMAFDPDSGNFCIFYMDGANSNYGTAHCGTVQSGSTVITIGSSDVVINSAYSSMMELAYDTTQNRFIFIYDQNGNSFYTRAVTCSGSDSSATISSIGSAVEIGSSDTVNSWPLVVHDSTAGKNIIAYIKSGTGLNALTATIDASTNAVTLGTINTVLGSVPTSDSLGLAYDPNVNKTILVYRENGSPYYSYYIELTVSGSDITASSSTLLYSANSQYKGLAYNATEQEIVIVIGDNTAYNTGFVFVPESTNLTSTNLLGLAPSAISDTATGTINTWGSRCENNDFFGTVTPSYGTPVTGYTSAGAENYGMVYDSTNNRLVVAYKDGSNSDYGTAVVGELSGTSITWGTPVVFSSTASGDSGLALTFDTNVNRVVIAYRDSGNSDYGTAIVGAVSGSGSGSTIAFGSATVFESANSFYIGAGFDPVENKVLLTYRDNGNSNYATYIIGTVTTGPDAISFNTAATLNGSDVMDYNARNIAFDTSQGKFLVTYTVSGVLKAMNLSISSGSGTVGTVSTYGSGSPYIWNPETIYDSGNSKTGINYGDSSGNYPLYFSVISMSGSSVTINTPVTISSQGNGALYGAALAYDPDLGKIGLAFRDDHTSGTSYQGSAFYGSISGTTSTWGTKSTWFSSSLGSSQTGIGAAYDTSSNKFAFVGSANAGNGVAVVSTLATTTLTIGTDYYVQTDGTLSTDTGGQLIGNAIKTNQINIKDYTG